MIVDRGQVEEVVDGLGELARVVLRDAELGLRQVAEDGDRARLRHAPVVEQRRHLVAAAFAHQEIHDAAFARQDFFDQALADEAAGAGDEILHSALLSFLLDSLPRPGRAQAGGVRHGPVL
jgi:hypothetical protein